MRALTISLLLLSPFPYSFSHHFCTYVLSQGFKGRANQAEPPSPLSLSLTHTRTRTRTPVCARGVSRSGGTELATHEVEEDSLKLAARERKWKRRRADARSAPTRWRSPGAQRSYTSKLLEALSRTSASGTSSPPRSRAVRDAADRILAVAAGGRTRWSSAILSSRRGLKLRRNRGLPRAVAPVRARPRKTWPEGATTKAPAKGMEGKVKTLGWLVPGCRNLTSLPSLLGEASDYIAALEMQVRAMSALAEALSSLGIGDAPRHSRGPGLSASSHSS